MKRVEEDQRRYPLYWPEGWKRTQIRQSAPYRVSGGRAREHLTRELTLMRAKRLVVSTNVPHRADGLPYANMRKPTDPGVAVYWTDTKGVERVIACDKWTEVEDNLRACGLAIEAMRALERTGASEILDRAFKGFAALPATTARSWREVLGFGPTETVTLADLTAEYRRRASIRHPDRGGSHEQMAELNAAHEAAKAEVGGG